MYEIIDLSEYRFGTPYKGMPRQPNLQTLCKGLSTRPIATIYMNLESSLVEIAYSRLSYLLKLPCIVSEWGYNILEINLSKAKKQPHRFVSVSFIGDKWIAYPIWMKKNPDIKISNPHDKDQHVCLSNLLLNFTWLDSEEGWIDENNTFIKAFNWRMFDGIDFYLSKGQSDKIISKNVSVTQILSTITSPESSEVLLRFANLTNEQLESCVMMPDCDQRNTYQNYILDKLTYGRDLAKKCLEALQE